MLLRSRIAKFLHTLADSFVARCHHPNRTVDPNRLFENVGFKRSSVGLRERRSLISKMLGLITGRSDGALSGRLLGPHWLERDRKRRL